MRLALRGFAANPSTRVFGRDLRIVVLQWVGLCARRRSVVVGREPVRPTRCIAANEVHGRGDWIRGNIRAHKDMQSEYAPQTVRYGRERAEPYSASSYTDGANSFFEYSGWLERLELNAQPVVSTPGESRRLGSWWLLRTAGATRGVLGV